MSSKEVNIAKGLGKGVEIAEEIRDQKSADNLFAGIFTGNPPFNQVFSDWPKPSAEEIKKRDKIVAELTDFLLKKVDPYLIDNAASVPLEVFESMARMGLYGLKVPEKWGGKGLSNTSYLEALSVSASWCSAIVIVLSADNTIGCKFPVMYYGTDEQKDRLLPELIKWPTGFCLTEKDVGSDASKIKEYAVRKRDNHGEICGYEITGEKWYTTNGILTDRVSLAKYLAVVARIVDHPDELKSKDKKECFGLFIVPTDSKGFDVGVRNTFVGMRGIHNSTPLFKNVYVSTVNLIGEKRPDLESKYGWGPREGSGLKIAFESLNTGRIAIAKGCIGVSKQALNLTRWWANKRSQLGGPLANKELVRDKLVYGATNILAMEAMAKYASICFDNGQDVRLEAAAVKVFASEKAWQIVDNMAQTRGGRFYETWQSLSRRELTPPDEILWTGSRPNRIFEGANEILVQLMFREGTDKFIKASLSFTGVLLKIPGYYFKTFLPYSTIGTDTRLMTHLEFVESSSRKLARKILAKATEFEARKIPVKIREFWLNGFTRGRYLKEKKEFKKLVGDSESMRAWESSPKFKHFRLDKYKYDLAVRQLILDRFSRIAINLGAMALTCAYAQQLDKDNPGHDYSQLADIFCRTTRREVDELFKALNDNDDEYRWKVSKKLLDGNFDDFLLGGIIPMTEEHMRGPKD